MLKITFHRNETPARIELEGRLAGPWVDEVRGLWEALARDDRPLCVVDLSSVTYVDADGKVLLGVLWRQGVELRATGCCTKYIVEEITGQGRDVP